MKILFLLLAAVFLIFISSCHLTAKEKHLDTDNKVEVILHFSDLITLQKSDCRATIPITRRIKFSENLIDSTLRLLLKGVTEDEKNKNLGDSFGINTSNPLIKHYIGVSVEGGRAIVHFKEGAMVYLNSALCEQDSVKAPIEKTLLEFPAIESVEYSIEGKIINEFDA